ncbi:hypothetical protein M433DRAFT_8115 [Acidomyces richmondensis BFW]|nr:hypothetical protein M433DRAFT_8115 [Acidomyces richmondensis BFW]
MAPGARFLVLCIASYVAAQIPAYPEYSDPHPKVTTIQQNANGAVPLFPYEKQSLSAEELQFIEEKLRKHYGNSSCETLLGLLNFSAVDVTKEQGVVNYTLAGPDNCKLFPGDAAYPSQLEWAALNLTTGGALLQPVPQAHICYANGTGNVPDPSGCSSMTEEWTNPFFQEGNPIEMTTPIYQGMTCQPPDIYNHTYCTQGGYPLYVIKATNVAQMQLAVNFARNTGIRLVIRNTGHDFSGKSGGAGALSVWTGNLGDIAYIADYKNANYSGAAFKVAAGVQDYAMYAAASEFGKVTLGGECPTVGLSGGYIQGGGHSPLSPLYGIAADQALGFEVVTSDGRFVTANSEENPDLFWALRGGGGSTYGIVSSVIIKAHPDIPITSASWEIVSGGNISTKAFSASLRAFFKFFPQGADAKTYSYFKVFPGYSFTMAPFFAPNKSLEDSKKLLQPWIDETNALGINVNITWQHFNGFLDAYNLSFPTEGVNNYGVVTASRMFPWANWANESIFNQTYNVLWNTLESGKALIGYNMYPSLEAGGCQNDSVNPAWRDAIGYVITGFQQNWTEPASERMAQHLNFTYDFMQTWRDITPGGGSYLNEADRIEPDFQWAFWGSFYPQLLELKKRYDPFNVFWAQTAVGSEFFEVRSIDGYCDENGKLCVKSNPSLYVAQGPDYVPTC